MYVGTTVGAYLLPPALYYIHPIKSIGQVGTLGSRKKFTLDTTIGAPVLNSSPQSEARA